MPTRRLRLTKRKAQECRARLLRLKEIGIPIRQVCDSLHERNRITVELAPDDYARIFPFPLSGVAVVLPARITVHTSGIVITDCQIEIGCHYVPLDLSEPESNPFYRNLVGESSCLNHWLVDKRPLRPRCEEGVILAHSLGSIPPNTTTVRV